MAYKDLLLPIGVDLEWRSSPGFKTSIVQTDNGKEKRNVDWSSSLMSGVLHYNARAIADWQAIDQMVQICQGRAHTFKVRDPRKWTATSAEGKFVAGQAVLRVTLGAYTIDKPITKLDASAVPTGGTVNILTGISADGATAWSGPFYLCCRFDVDQLELTGVDKQGIANYIAGFKDVPIVEVLGE